MAPGFSDDFKELVRSRTDLVSLVSETISLTPQRGGLDYVALCPFHEDHNPSFHVYPDRQSYRCWVCEEGGDCFSWVMGIDGVGFREALESLAQRANIEIPKSHQRGPSTSGQDKASLYDVLAWAETEFHRCLLESAEAKAARDYLAERGFQSETIAKFRIGYHPNDWEWTQRQAGRQFPTEQLLTAGLVGQSDRRPGYYDNFVDRVLFPIRDERSRPVAFGGRVLPGNPNPDLAKYWNSPESPVFTKSKLLYGLDSAKEPIRQSKTAVVVEGYTDCIIANQYGLSNVVGTLGTALTETHVTGLKRFARKVVLVYDGDQAGQNAAERSLAKFLAQDVDLRILTLPDGMDPADYLAEHGIDAFNTLIEEAAEAWEHKFRSTSNRYGLDTIDARQRVLEEMLELLCQSPRLSGTVREDIILSKLAQRLQLTEASIRHRLQEVRQKNNSRRPSTPSGGNSIRVDAGADGGAKFYKQKLSKDDKLECELLEIIFTSPDIIDSIRQELGCEDIRNLHIRQLVQLCFDLAEQGIAPTCEAVTTRLENLDLKALAVWIADQALQKSVEKKINEGRTSTTEDATANYVRQVLDPLKWRQEEQLHQRSKGQLAQQPIVAGGSDQDAEALLRQATEYHQKRAGKKTLT